MSAVRRGKMARAQASYSEGPEFKPLETRI